MCIINLVSAQMPEENKLSIMYESLLKDLDFKNYVAYDFHQETKGDKFHKVSDLINQIAKYQNDFGYFVRHQFGSR
jgi:hypothetical protein